MTDYKLVLYGSGKRCKILCKILAQANANIIAIIDSNPNKWGEEFEGYSIDSPEKMREFGDGNVCITISDFEAVKIIRKQLNEIYQYSLSNEVGYNELILRLYKENLKIKERILSWEVYKDRENTILFDCYNGLGLGGVEAWTMDVCGALINKGKENIYIVSDNGSYKVPSVLAGHIINADINHNERFLEKSVLSLINIMMERLPFKVVTCTTNEIMLAAYLIKCQYPNMVEIISVIHNSNEKVYMDYIDFKECSDIYIGVSEDIKDGMVKRGIQPENIYSMTCPFPCERILSRTYSDNCYVPIKIGYAGRMEYSQKRMDLVLNLMEILEKDKVDFSFELAGDGAARQKMEEFVSCNNLGSKVKFLGRLEREEVFDFWRKQDICVNLADYEGRSLSIIEAMGNGAVPVVTEVSGVREDIVDSVNGYIVPLEDYQTMADRIKYLASHRERLSEMGQLAHDTVYPKSLMKSHLEFWEKIFHVK